jgi:murein L,D-transpeptidase YcbB/YkuD
VSAAPPPDASVAPPGPSAAPPENVLELWLPLYAPSQTHAATLEAALATWRLPPSGAEEIELEELHARLRDVHLEMLPVAPDLRALQEVSMPAIVSLRDPSGVRRSALLRRLGDGQADLEGVALNTTLRVSTADLLRHLDGAAFALWRDFEELPETLTRGDRGDGVRWLQRALGDLGYYGGDVHGDFDPETEKAVGRFQSDQGLPADGRVGPRTQMRLYEALPRYATPTLFAEPVDLANAL